MPTISKLLGDIDWYIVQPMLIKLQHGDLTDRHDLLSIIVQYINNSVVGTFKVLHFIALDHVPISTVGFKYLSALFESYK
jgi:hypothetical protein